MHCSFLPEVAQVLTLVHDGITSGWHLELDLILGSPGDGVTFASGSWHVSTSAALKHGELGRLKQVFWARNGLNNEFLALCASDHGSSCCQQSSATHSGAKAIEAAAFCGSSKACGRLCHWSAQTACTGTAWDHESHSCNAQHGRSQTHHTLHHDYLRWRPNERASRAKSQHTVES